MGDCGSQNGTAVNGQKIEGYHRLNPDDCIRIASHEVRFTDNLAADDSSLSDLSELSVLESPTRAMGDESTRLDLKKAAQSSSNVLPQIDLAADDGASADGSIA